jgi:ribonuclease J
MPTGKLHIVPLGGMGEFGMNCMAIRFGDDIVVVDAGLMFPEAELLGVDIVVPDISYLLENRKHVRGIVLTHGHEDHIGALPWIFSELNVPVWGTEFTLAYVEDKLDEHQLLDDADLREIRPGERFKLGPFTIHPLQVTHSLVDCVALAIHTPLGVVLHTGELCIASLKKYLPAPSAVYSFPAFHLRFTASSSPLTWRGSTAAKSVSLAVP